VNLTSRVSYRWTRPDPEPAALLGAGHPLVRDLEQLATAVNQLLVVAGVFAGSVVAWLEGFLAAVSLIAAAAPTGLLFTCRLAVLVESRRANVLELISEGRADLPISAVQQMCARIGRATHRQRLARSVNALLESKVQRWDLVVSPWRSLSADVVAPILHELMEISALLRDDEAGLQGIAMMERLLTDGTSSLHGDDAQLLGEDLRRARFLLAMRQPRR
jgi:hypothetical protein